MVLAFRRSTRGSGARSRRRLHPLLPAQPRRIPRHLSGSLDLSTDVRIAQNMAARLNCWSPARSELHPSIGDLRHAAAFGQQAGGIACHHGRGLPASGLHRADQIDAVAHQVCGDPKAPMRRRRPPSLLRLNERPSFVLLSPHTPRGAGSQRNLAGLAFSMTKQLHLGAVMRPVAIHTAWWRYPGAYPDANFNLKHLVRFIQTLEQARFDAFFMADHLAVLNMPIRRCGAARRLPPSSP